LRGQLEELKVKGNSGGRGRPPHTLYLKL
jgi:hypothetical protein